MDLRESARRSHRRGALFTHHAHERHRHRHHRSRREPRNRRRLRERPLQANRLNQLFVTTFNPAGRSAPVPAAVLQDAQPPSLFIDFPKNGDELTNVAIVISGRVGDMLSGFQGLSVSVNGQSATVNVGIGNNGTFERSAVPLAMGPNVINATAIDINGNTMSIPSIPSIESQGAARRCSKSPATCRPPRCTRASRNPSS